MNLVKILGGEDGDVEKLFLIAMRRLIPGKKILLLFSR